LPFDSENLQNLKQSTLRIEANIGHYRGLQSDIRREQIKAECEAHLVDFIRHGFETVEVIGRPFAPGRHIEMMCEHLEAAVGATAIAATVADPTVFRSGRDFAAWIGLVPRQDSTKVRFAQLRRGGEVEAGEGFSNRRFGLI
jgi:transposase